jgi:TadE-like protein
MKHSRLRGDEATAVLEAAFALPILLFLLLGAADVGTAIFHTSQATSAARDGARVGIVHYLGASDTTSSDYQNYILPAIRGRLPGQTFNAQVLCTHAGSSINCASAETGDVISVTVTWSYAPISPFGRSFGAQTIKGTSQMRIVGEAPVAGFTPSTTTTTTSTTTTSTTSTTAPTSTTTSTTSTTTTTVPGSCAVQGANVTPAPPLQHQNKNKFTTSYTVTITTNGAATCTGLKIRYNVSAPYSRNLTPSPAPTTWKDTIPDTDGDVWPQASGSGTVTVTADVLNSSNQVLPGGTFSITVQ